MLALLTLTLGWTNASAQTWTASEVEAGNFYLYNVGKGQFLTRGNGYGTQASTGASALTLTIEEYNGAYKLRTNVNGDGKGLERLADPVIYTDQSINKNSTWTFTTVADASNGPVYTIVSAENHNGGAGSYMTASADNTIVGPADAVTDDYGRWQLFQAWITNTMPVINADGWTVSQTPTFDGGNICAEFWNKSGASIKQTVNNLPAGSYELIAVALTRDGMTATLNAGTNTMSIVTVSRSVVDNRGQANTWFNNGNGVNKLEFTHAGGSLEIGLTADNANGDHWLVWRSFVLLYKGVDLTALREALQAQIDAVPALEGTTTTAAYNAAKNYADGIDVNNLTTEEAISAAATELANLVNAAKALQTNYARYNTVKAAALAIATSLDTTTPDAAFDAATTNDAIEAAIASLRATFLAELPNLTIPEADYIDVTAVMVDNAGVHTNTDYWTIEGTPNGGYSFGVCNYGECEFYNCNFKFYQTLALTPGTWEFGVTGFHRAGNHNTHFYAGEDKILIPGVANTVVNSMAEAQNYFNNGNGKVALKFLIETAGNVEIGIDNQDTETDKWTIFRDFTLKYYGAPDYSVYENQWTALVANANAAKDDAANANVTGSELTALNAAIADEPDGSGKANYLEKINALEAALTVFTAAAPSYDKYVAYRAETVAAFGETLAATVPAPTTAAGALVAVQNLNIAQYNKVAADYTHSLEAVIGNFGTWTGTATYGADRTPSTPNYLSNEHWSGQTHAYYEQCAEGWGNAGGWTIKYEKTCTLPAGDYVVKVAARSAGAGVTSLVSCSATTATVTLPAESAYARGIKKNGDAGWDGENSDYARDGVGYGWQWRFLPFTLTEETEVSMTFEASATTQYQWMSIADGTLLSKQEINNVVTISDEDVAAPSATVASQVNTDRKLLEGLNTIILPFEVTAEEIGAATVLEYTGTTTGTDDAVTLNFHEVAPVDDVVTLQANTPYAVMVDADQTENLSFGLKNIAPSENLTVEDANANFNFVGTYTDLAKNNPVVVAGDYVAGATAFKKAKGGNRIKAYRAYLKKISEGDVQVKFNFGGDIVDGIEAIELLNNLSVDGIYNLQGQKVNAAQKGIYIVNGKKVVVK